MSTADALRNSAAALTARALARTSEVDGSDSGAGGSMKERDSSDRADEYAEAVLEGARIPLAGGRMNDSPSSEASVLDDVVLGGGRVPVDRTVLGGIKERCSRDRDDDVVIVEALVLVLDEAEESVGATEGRRVSRSFLSSSRSSLEAWRTL